MSTPAARVAVLALLLGCAGDATPSADSVATASADSAARAVLAGAAAGAWLDGGGGIAYRAERQSDLTGDGRPELIAVRAAGPDYDSLDVTLVIAGPAGDTLWLEQWNSVHYFAYLDRHSLGADSVAAIVRGHVAVLLADSAFQPRAAAADAQFRSMVDESVQYHLAELDWRNAAGLDPGDATPPDAFDRIDAARVSPDRVNAVVRELLAGPTFGYYAGGEVTYVIGWSVRETSFVRLLSCC